MTLCTDGPKARLRRLRREGRWLRRCLLGMAMIDLVLLLAKVAWAPWSRAMAR